MNLNMGWPKIGLYGDLGLRDGAYERRRSIFCGPDGILGQSFCQMAQDGHRGTIIKTSIFPKGTEEAFALIGRRQQLNDHIGHAHAKTGGSIESTELRWDFHFLRSSRKRLNISSDIAGNYHVSTSAHIPKRCSRKWPVEPRSYLSVQTTTN